MKKGEVKFVILESGEVGKSKEVSWNCQTVSSTHLGHDCKATTIHTAIYFSLVVCTCSEVSMTQSLTRVLLQ